MPVTVTRIYDSEAKAKQAAADVKQHASPGQVVVVTPSEGGSAEDALTKTGLPTGSAKAYAEAVGRGRSVVSVAPAFGRAAPVTAALDRAGPVDTDVTDVAEVPPAKTTRGRSSATAGTTSLIDNPTPLSTLLGIPVLLNEQKKPD